MLNFIGAVVLFLLPLLMIALAMGRRMEDNEEKSRNDELLRDGLRVLKNRVRSLERIWMARKGRRE